MKNKNQNLYIAQFIATVCVVVVHSGTIVSDPTLHFIVKSMICRIAVPFFFVNNAYFFRLNSKREVAFAEVAEKDSISLCSDIYALHTFWYSVDTTDSPSSFRITTNSTYCLFLLQWELLSFVVFSCFSLLDSYCEIHASKTRL